MNALKARSLAVTLALIAAICTTISIQPAAALEMQQGSKISLLAGPDGPSSYVRPVTPTVPQPEAATFVVTYTGFSAAAKAAFQRAVNIWAGQVTSSVPITVSATYQPLGTGVLGQAGAGNYIRDFPGAPKAGTWYAIAIANKRYGKRITTAPDIVAQFSSNFPNWHFGTGPAPAGKYDFTSVVLHELGHGLGFAGFGRVASGIGSVKAAGFPGAYDWFTENNAGTAMLSFPDSSAALAAQLQGGNLYFDSPAVRAANGNVRARLYAINPFRSGSSYSHLNEATYGRGNANSLMTPILGLGETIRSPGPITLAIFRSEGW